MAPVSAVQGTSPAVGAAHPYIDDRRAVDVDAQGAATELARWVQSGERADHGCEVRVGCSPDTGRETSPGTRMSGRSHATHDATQGVETGRNVDIRSL